MMDNRMTKLQYTVRFATPAFLGDAEQQAQWRTPPFKALIRQWWRIAQYAKGIHSYEDIREKEGLLFGNAWLAPSSDRRSRHCKSRVTLRLDRWSNGTLDSKTWPGGPMEYVKTAKNARGEVRADVYLGFGPVIPESKREGRHSITIRKAINTTDHAVLALFPAPVATELSEILQLITWFGTIGSRARNGWGSLSLEPLNDISSFSDIPFANDPLLRQVNRNWRDCLKQDWPHAIGSSAGTPLIWKTTPCENWRQAMGRLANIRVHVRQVAKQFKGPAGIGGIHLLGYPAGSSWNLREIGKEARLGTQLRFKVAKTAAGLVGIVFHVPCTIPKAFNLTSAQRKWVNENQESVWSQIHKSLNEYKMLAPLSGDQRNDK